MKPDGTPEPVDFRFASVVSEAATAPRPARRAGFGLSSKLLLLTVLFVMLSEVLIFLPSIANYRINWMMDRLQAAQLAALAAQAAPGGVLPDMLKEKLLKTAMVHGVAVKRDDQRILILAEDMPVAIDAHYDLRTATLWQRLTDALAVYFHADGRIVRVIGEPTMGGPGVIEMVISEDPLKSDMIKWGLSILGLSVLISLVTAALVYLALLALLVRPMRRITNNIVAFASDPDNSGNIIRPSTRGDEIGTAERVLAQMQGDLNGLLRQKSHLAALGLAVSKISHDLRNVLSSAQLISDRLGMVQDPTVQRMTPKLIASLDRAIRLCTETLKFGRASESPPVRKLLKLKPLVADVAESLGLPRAGRIELAVDAPDDIEVDADGDQLFRILGNLGRNSMQVLESNPRAEPHLITIAAKRSGRTTVIYVKDTGPGVPEQARAKLFVAFQGTVRSGGTGLGLAIVDELVRGHGGEVSLLTTGPGEGATFRIVIPDRA